MFSVNIQNNLVSLRDILKEQLKSILSWCNITDDFSFASGINRPLSLEDLESKYSRIILSDSEFFLGIYSLKEDKLVGILTGKLAGSAVWINMLAIGYGFRCKGYGRTAIELLLQHMVGIYGIRTAYLAVAVNNIKGRRFWLNNGFIDKRHAPDKSLLKGAAYKVIIMQKRL